MEMASDANMPNAQLDQFMHALIWKIGRVMILCGGGGILLREGIRWFERRTTPFDANALQD